jgi:uncharacterized membrane protein
MMQLSTIVTRDRNAMNNALLLVLLGVFALVILLAVLVLFGADMSHLHAASVPTGHSIAATTGDVHIGNG